jgi:endonuclease III
MPEPAAIVGPQSLAQTLDELAPLYAPPAPLTDPLALIVWENVGYLIPDERRQPLFDELADRVGLTSARLADAPEPVLLDIASRGGMRPADRVERLRSIGRIALEAGGDLAQALKDAGPAKTRTILKRFPGIADPGVDKILLFTGLEARPALESNGVRALVRLGYASEGAAYAHAYRSAIAALKALGPERERLIQAFQLLRAHGQALCKRTAPHCVPCPLDPVCAHAPVKSL